MSNAASPKQYGSVSDLIYRRSPQPPLKRGAIFLLYPLKKGVKEAGDLIRTVLVSEGEACGVGKGGSRSILILFKQPLKVFLGGVEMSIVFKESAAKNKSVFDVSLSPLLKRRGLSEANNHVKANHYI
jgi:hypothetical protein